MESRYVNFNLGNILTSSNEHIQKGKWFNLRKVEQLAMKIRRWYNIQVFSIFDRQFDISLSKPWISQNYYKTKGLDKNVAV